MHSFVAMDLEHCNSSYASVCSIGVARVVDSSVVARKHWIVRPAAPFDVAHSRHLTMTGLTFSEIEQGRDFGPLADSIERSIGDAVMVMHNRHADGPLWQQASLSVGRSLPRWSVVDTVDLADALGLPRKLGQLYEHFHGKPLDGHHNAAEDAAATAGLAVRMLDMLGASVDDWAVPYRFKPMSLEQVKLPKHGRRLAARREVESNHRAVKPLTA